MVDVDGREVGVRSVGGKFVRVGEADGGVGLVVAEEHGVGIEAEAEVGRAVPVLQIVAGEMLACLCGTGGKVGDLVLGEAVFRKPSTSSLIELGGEVVGRRGGSVEALAAGEEFEAEARVFVYFKHVDAEVGEAYGGGDFKRVLPAGGGLVGEAGDEVGADFRDAGGLKAKDLVDAIAFGMESADGLALAVDEGLDAEADAIDAEVLRGGEDFVRDLAGGGFEGDLGGGAEGEVAMEGGEDALELRGCEETGGSAAEVEGVDCAW